MATKVIDFLKRARISKGKVLLVDYLSTEARERVHLAGVSLAVECVPGKALPAGEANFALLAAVLDQVRLAEDSSVSFEEYLQQWVKRAEADRAPVVGTERLPRRCAFVLHALSREEFFRLRGQKLLARAPQPVRSLAGAVAARLPVVHLGALSGAVSRATGQEVVCDVFAHLAAPQEIGALGEERIYDRMVQAARLAKGRGASLLGLGDFIEGVGDGGVTIAQRSPIPVTLGSSYSVSTRLWAARRMLERLALVQPSADGKRYLAKAMVIGATDSLGRVSSLLLALAAGELVLVAARPDKLVELQREIREVAPGVKVTVATQAGAELATTDLIVTASSPFSGAVLDLEQVKPGAVICDGAAGISPADADERPDVMVVQSGEVLLPGEVRFDFDWGALTPSVAASMAETVLLTMEGRFESFSLSRQLSLDKVKQIYQLGLRHGATLSQIRGPHGVIGDEQVKRCRELAFANRS